jgi:hypothetical protein
MREKITVIIIGILIGISIPVGRPKVEKSKDENREWSESVTNTARAYFKAGVESALMVKTLQPELRGADATRAAYIRWMIRSPDDHYITETPPIKVP